MAKKDNYIKSKTLYSIKNKHANTKNGLIYENDYVTIINDGIYDDEMALYSDSNFKYLIKKNNNEKKRHSRSNFVEPETGEDFWTKKDIKTDTISEESKIIIKPNYNSINDFAYYGSAVELIRASINDIILRFPGGLYFYEENLAPEMEIRDTKYLFISNECKIDFWSQVETLNEKTYNPLRVLSLSKDKYVIEGGFELSYDFFLNTTDVYKQSICGYIKFNNGIMLNIYNDNNNDLHLVATENYIKNNDLYGKTIIEPKQEIIDKFWDSLDDFQRVLLNKETIPLYTSIINTPFTADTGYYYTPQYYTWPTVGTSITPYFTGFEFQNYINSLIELSEFHDDYDTNNIWRMMTHESIKNLDRTTFSNESELDEIDDGKMKAILHIQGRIYDDVKRYADNIKYINSVSYDQKNNSPDYFLSDIVENEGWEAKNTAPSNEETNFNISIDYIDSDKNKTLILEKSGKTMSYMNSLFQRRLLLSSKYIQSMKGTRKGLEAILGMFGYVNELDYTISEYIASASCETLPNSNDFQIFTSTNIIDIVDVSDFLQFYPVALIESATTTNEVVDVLIPWYEPVNSYWEEPNFYFQSKGGWGKMYSKNITKPDLTKLTDFSGNDLYSETEPYLLYLEDLEALTSLPVNKIKNGMICYVADTNNIEEYYGLGGNKEPNPSDDLANASEEQLDKWKNFIKEKHSKYFILINDALSTRLGYVNTDLYKCYGWYNIKKHEFDGSESPTEYGTKVLYLETIIPNYKSNNPHTGKGEYDFGESYLEKFATLYRNALKDGTCDNLDEETLIEAKKTGFGDIKSFINNDKCSIVIDKDQLLGSEIENSEIQDEVDSYKTINIKNLSIHFKYDNKEFKKYVKEVVLPYLEVMIPSTTIYEILFGANETETILEVKNEYNKETEQTLYSSNILMDENEIWTENSDWKNNL